jgi:hypothetical protein
VREHFETTWVGWCNVLVECEVAPGASVTLKLRDARSLALDSAPVLGAEDVISGALPPISDDLDRYHHHDISLHPASRARRMNRGALVSARR